VKRFVYVTSIGADDPLNPLNLFWVGCTARQARHVGYSRCLACLEHAAALAGQALQCAEWAAVMCLLMAVGCRLHLHALPPSWFEAGFTFLCNLAADSQHTYDDVSTFLTSLNLTAAAPTPCASTQNKT
jgi:hypothetical protein